MLLTSHPICDHFSLSQHSVLTSFVQMLACIVLAAFYYAATAAVDCKGKSDKPYFVSSNNKYSLWPGLASNYDLAHGDTLPGLESVSISTLFIEDCLLLMLLIMRRLSKLYGETRIHRIVPKLNI